MIKLLFAMHNCLPVQKARESPQKYFVVSKMHRSKNYLGFFLITGSRVDDNVKELNRN